MDLEHANNNITNPKVCILESGRVIARNSSLGCSSRVFYYRSAEGVPFQWEMQPGTPKDPPKQDFLPPITPPPALLSLSFPKPCIHIEEPNKVISIKSRLKLWKYIMKTKIRGIKKLAYNGSYKGSNNINNNTENATGSDKFERVEFCSSDGASPRNSSFSSSSTSQSFSNNVNSSQFSRLKSAPRDSIHGIYGCSPWNLTSSLVSVPRRA